VRSHKNKLNNFIGFQFAASNPSEAGQCLIRASQHPSLTSQIGRELVTRSQALLSEGGNYLNNGRCIDERLSDANHMIRILLR